MHDRVQNSSGSGLIFMEVSGSGSLGFIRYSLNGFGFVGFGFTGFSGFKNIHILKKIFSKN